MDKKQQIFDWLDGERGRWPAIAERSGVNYWWVLKFMAGGIKKPGYDKLDALQKQMQRDRRAARRREREARLGATPNQPNTSAGRG